MLAASSGSALGVDVDGDADALDAVVAGTRRADRRPRRHARRRAGRHDVAVRHRRRRARLRADHRSTARRRCGGGRWPRCTTPSPQLGAASCTGERAGGLPVTVAGPLRDGGDLAIAGRRQQPVPHRADADRPAARRRAPAAAHDAARVRARTSRLTAAVMASFGVDGVDRRRRDRRARGPLPGPDAAVEPDASLGQLPAGDGGRRRRPGPRPRPAPRARRRATPCSPTCSARWGARSTTTTPGTTCPATRRRADRHRRRHGRHVRPRADARRRRRRRRRRRPTISGVGFIRAKESDRIGDLSAELRPLGADVDREPDGLRIEPAGPLHGAVLGTHHDHRLAMAFGVLGTASPASGSPTPTSWRRAGRVLDGARALVDAVSGAAVGAGRPATMAAVPEPVDVPRPVVAAFDVDGTLTTGLRRAVPAPGRRHAAGRSGACCARSVPSLAALVAP